LFTAFGIRVRAHAMLLVVLVLVLMFGLGGFGSNLVDRLQVVSVLFTVILLHEFGHCFAARWVGGAAEEIILTPLGGLAMTMAPRRPWATFVTVAGGPAVNVLICLVCGVGFYFITGIALVGPWDFGEAHDASPGWFQVSNYLFWFYSVSWVLLVFNLMPVFPLDGGQLLQSILWKPMGYYKSMMVTLNVGMVGSVVMVLAGLGLIALPFGGFLTILIGVNCFINCLQLRRMMKAEGPWAFADEDEGVNYSASLQGGASGGYSDRDANPAVGTRRGRRRGTGRLGRWAAKRARKQAQAEQDEQAKIDAILAKVSAHGMHSLNWWEKRTLRRATERQRKRDLEVSRGRAR
jgi:Zn-dependent protease